MARIIGRPGYQEAQAAVRNTLAAAFGLPSVAFAAVAYMAIAQGSAVAVSAVVAVWALVAFMGWRWIRLDLAKMGRNLRSFSESARAEAETIRRLELLPDSFTVLNGFRFAGVDRLVEGWSIDHVVVGPTGVFAVATRSTAALQSDLRGRRARSVGPHGEASDHVRRLVRSAADLEDALRVVGTGVTGQVRVRPVLVEVGALGAAGPRQADARASTGKQARPALVTLDELDEHLLEPAERGRLSEDAVRATTRAVLRQAGIEPDLAEL